MATEYSQTGRSVSIGRILSRTFSAITGNPGVMLLIAFVFGAIPQTAIDYYQQFRVDPVDPGGLLVVVLVGSFASLVFNLIVQGALVRATMAEIEGERATLGECLATGLSRSLPLLGVAMLTGLGISVGFLLLIVPGIIFYLMWSVAVPVTVIERRGVVESMSRSGDLTAGARGTIFALMLIVGVVTVGAGMISGAVSSAIDGVDGIAQTVRDGLPIAFLVVNAVVTTLATMFASAVPTALYVELREWKEGEIGESLADIFA